MKIYNTLSRNIEEFNPVNPPYVGMYTCGMTVYDYAHIGHGRKYVGDDILRRTLTFLGYEVNHVQNVTDVGHLVSDADEGEDKLEKGAKKTGKTVWEVAAFFTENFYDSMDKLNILRPNIICKATDHIKEQIELIQKLINNNLAYDTPEAIYFNINNFKNYTELFGQQLDQKKSAVREEVKTGEYKRNNADFALWFKRQGRFADHAMHWDSPWGDGFPGWHIECSAMSMKYLGNTIDIHTGGIDHIPVHHPNEIAQSEGATGQKFVNYWVHYNHLMVDGQKMSKSLGNFYRVTDIIDKGYDPLSLRYLYLTVHYRKQMNFTWQALDGAANSLKELKNQIINLLEKKEERSQLSQEKLSKIDTFRKQFIEAISSDINTPQALATVWEVIKSNIPSADKYDLLLDFDSVLGLNLNKIKTNIQEEIPEEIVKLIKEREEARINKDFVKSDKIRIKLEKFGIKVKDTKQGQITEKIK